MRQTLALFFIGLIAMTSALQTDVQFLKQLKRKTYGKTLLDTIQVQLLSHSNSKGNGIDEVVQVLKDLQASQAAEQAQDDSENSAFQSQTQETVGRLTSEINQLESNIANDNALIVSNEATIASQQAYQASQEADLAQQQQNLADNLDNQNQTTTRFVNEFNALSAQITGLAEAKQVLQQLVAQQENVNYQTGRNGAGIPPQEQQQELLPEELNLQPLSFIQVKSALSNIKFQHGKYQGMINVLSQLMTSQIVSDQAQVQNILDIIDRLSEQLRSELKTLQANYDQTIADLKAVQANLENQIATDQVNIQAAKVRIAQLQQDNVDAAQRILQDTQSRDSDVTQRADAVQAGVNRQQSHDQNTSRRTNENAVIEEVVQIFQSRFSDDVRAVVRTL